MGDARAVLFDIDGVLVDSYRAHFEAWRALAAEQSFDLTEAQFAATFGRTSREIIAERWGAELSEAEIAALDRRKEAFYRQKIEEDFPTMPGAPELLAALRRAGFRLAVASSGPPENVELSLRHLDGDTLFSAAVSGADVTRGKPDPEVFLIAAQRLGVAPSRCAVVEDAPAGVAAAKAASMVSIALVSTGRIAEALGQADLVVASLADLSPQMIGALIDSAARSGKESAS